MKATIHERGGLLLLAMAMGTAAGPLAAQEPPRAPAAGARVLVPAVPGGWLGIRFDVGSGVEASGAPFTEIVIGEVVEDGPARAAGLRAGDRVLRIDGEPATMAVMQRLTERLQPGDTVRVQIARGDRSFVVGVRAAERPALVLYGPAGTLTLRAEALQSRVAINLDSMRSEMARVPFVRADSLIVGALQAVQAARTLPTGAIQVAPLRGTATIDQALAVHRFRIDSLTALQAGRAPVWTGSLETTGPPRGAMVIFSDTLRRAPAIVDAERFMWRSTPSAAPTPARAGAVIHAGLRTVAGVELVPLNPELGGYFGVARGVLVTSVVEATPMARGGVRAGDVIVRVAGREVTTVAEVREALGQGLRSPPVAVRVIRERAPIELSIPR